MTVAQHFKNTLGQAILKTEERHGQEIICVSPEHLRAVVMSLKTELAFDLLLDIVAIDWQSLVKPRFEVDYLFCKIEGPALSGVEGPAPSGVEGPAPSGVEGPAPSGVEGPAPSGVEGARRVTLKVPVIDDKNPQLDSITDIFSSADWAEREVFDMMGIHFKGHPNLKRLLMWSDFQGHPLRKDYDIKRRQPIPVLDDIV